MPYPESNNRAAVYSFSALENYAGYQKPNDLLDKLAKERTTDEPPKPIRFGTYRSEIKNPLAPAPAKQGRRYRWMS